MPVDHGWLPPMKRAIPDVRLSSIRYIRGILPRMWDIMSHQGRIMPPPRAYVQGPSRAISRPIGCYPTPTVHRRGRSRSAFSPVPLGYWTHAVA
jgi:hypothetical protein